VFKKYLKQKTITFPLNYSLLVIEGFDDCLIVSIVSIEIPASVERINDFNGHSFSQLILAEGTMIGESQIGKSWLQMKEQ
jgi:hypothetical protein